MQFLRSSRGLVGIAVAALAFGVAQTAEAASFVVPGPLEAVEGSDNNGFPFNLGVFPASFGLTEMRWQQMYAASEFGGGPILISGVNFRPDDTEGAAFGPVTLDGIVLTLSTSGLTVGTMSSTFADNVGVDETVVFSGDLTLSSANTGAGPRDFDVAITFDTPFLYDPSAGDLLFGVVNTDPETTTQFDALSALDPGADLVARLYNRDVSSPTGEALPGARGSLVTQFQTAPVPEPGTFALVGLGLLGLGAGVVRRRRRAKQVVDVA